MSLRPEIPGTPADSSDQNVSSVASSNLASVTWPDLHPYPGSYYHKEVTPVENASEIDAIVKLGDPTYDWARPPKVDHSPDDFSIYLGATEGQRTIDAGFSWEITLDKNGHKDSVHRAWRPFWRISGHPLNWHAAPPESKFYWHPGDEVKMSLRVSGPDKLVLTVADPGPKPAHKFSVEFSAPGVKPGQPISFRRITSIDQSGSEGHKVQPTHAKLLGTVWQSTLVKQNIGGVTSSLPMSLPHESAIDTPSGHAIVRTLPAATNPGGEAVDIYGELPKSDK